MSKSLLCLIQASTQASPEALQACPYLPDAGPELLTLALLQDNPFAPISYQGPYKESLGLLNAYHHGAPQTSQEMSALRADMPAKLALRAWCHATRNRHTLNFLNYESN